MIRVIILDTSDDKLDIECQFESWDGKELVELLGVVDVGPSYTNLNALRDYLTDDLFGSFQGIVEIYTDGKLTETLFLREGHQNILVGSNVRDLVK